MIYYLVTLLLILYFPFLFSVLFSLEKDADEGESVLRWIFWGILFILFLCGRRLELLPFAVRIVIWSGIAFLLAELFVRIYIKTAEKSVLDLLSDARGLYERTLELSTLEGQREPVIEPHPFIQFTDPRGKDSRAGARFVGFKGWKTSDVPKADGIIRIICVGGSTTATGYPEWMQNLFDECCTDYKFQILNFGKEWWSSVQTTVNFVMNVIDFKPDYVIFHNNCNDHNYRGYPVMAGDASHAYKTLVIPPDKDVSLYRFSVIYRFFKKSLMKVFPCLKRQMFMDKLALKPGKTFRYDPAEEWIFRRNLRTIQAVSKEFEIKLMLMTMPYSNEKFYSKEHDAVYRPHIRRYNDIMRQFGVKNAVPVIEAEAVLTGEEVFFTDPVHLRDSGKCVKAYLVAREILSTVKNASLSLNEFWAPVEKFVRMKLEVNSGNLERSEFDSCFANYDFAVDLSSDTLEIRVLSEYKKLLDDKKTIVLFGAGKHTEWLVALLKKKRFKLPEVIFDENPKERSVMGVKIVEPDSDYITPETVIVLSTDTIRDVFERRCSELFPETILKYFYEGMPPGPYEKKMSRNVT
jgi:hypothetical protein